MKVVKFAYYDDFHCIGPECPETCCQQWEIIFSRREYLDYKNAKCSLKLKKAIDNAFTRIKDGDDLKYAVVKFDENGYCPMLDSDGLCMVQKELGEKALSYVCSIYPRMHAKVGNDVFIFACDITCPHVIEVLINHPEGLEIVEEEYDGSNKFLNKGLRSASSTSESWVGYPFYWIIKNAQIDILQNRNFTIPERLLILGFFSKKADEYMKMDQGEKIESLYNMILDNEFSKSIADSLKSSQSDREAATRSLNNFLKMYQTNKLNLISEMFEQAAQSIEFKIEKFTEDDSKVKISYSIEKYSKNIEMFRGIEADRGYIFENVLVNLAFITPPNEGVFKSFFELAIFYNILKICLPAFLKDGWNDTDLALAITYSAKMVINTKMAERVSEKDFVEHNSFDLPHAAFLIS